MPKIYRHPKHDDYGTKYASGILFKTASKSAISKGGDFKRSRCQN